ncbi:MAG: hypothetical protein JNK04_25585 [Myxococcales bacterium]|nr:hypothetical protein [Myxococcales bacterium]
MKRKHIGSTLHSLLDELGETEQLNLLAEKKSLAAELGRAMAERNTKSALAQAMRTSRIVVHTALNR